MIAWPADLSLKREEFEPYEEMMIGLIHLAFKDLERYPTEKINVTTIKRINLARKRARRWLFEDDDRAFPSFRACCSYLGIDVDIWRTRARLVDTNGRLTKGKNPLVKSYNLRQGDRFKLMK